MGSGGRWLVSRLVDDTAHARIAGASAGAGAAWNDLWQYMQEMREIELVNTRTEELTRARRMIQARFELCPTPSPNRYDIINHLDARAIFLFFVRYVPQGIPQAQLPTHRAAALY